MHENRHFEEARLRQEKVKRGFIFIGQIILTLLMAGALGWGLGQAF